MPFLTCVDCRGTGRRQGPGGWYRCPECGGGGFVIDRNLFGVGSPAGHHLPSHPGTHPRQVTPRAQDDLAQERAPVKIK